MFSPRAPGSCGVQLQPTATLVEIMLSVKPVPGLLIEICRVVISCLQLWPVPPQFSFLQDPKQTMSSISMTTFPSGWSCLSVLFSTRKGQTVWGCFPSSISSSTTDTARWWNEHSLAADRSWWTVSLIGMAVLWSVKLKMTEQPKRTEIKWACMLGITKNGKIKRN